MAFDIRTLIFINLITNLVNSLAVAIIWRQTRGRYKGVWLWLLGMLCQGIGAGFILPRGSLPELLTVMIPNLLLLGGAMVIFLGLEQFTETRNRRGFNLAVLIVFLGLIYYFTAVQPDVFMRIVIFSLAGALVYGRMALLMLRRVKPALRRVTRYTGWVMLGYTLASLVRVALMFLFQRGTSDLFNSGVLDGWIITVFFVLGVSFTISLIIMVNTMLVQDARVQEEKFNKSFHSSPFAILLITLSDGRVAEVNDGFVRLTGYSAEEAVGKTTFELDLWVRDEDRREVIRDTLRNRRIRGREIQIRKKGGALMTGMLSIEIIVIDRHKYVLASIGDITELSEMKAKLERLATHDALTGLPNRTLLYDRAEKALANARRYGKEMAVMSMDLDKFKAVNDSLGHDAGDAVLVETGQRLLAAVREADTVARFGGDEFIILLSEIQGRDDAIEVAARVLERMRDPLQAGKKTISLSVSIGVAFYPQHGDDFETLLKRSDEALYRAKDAGRNRFGLAE